MVIIEIANNGINTNAVVAFRFFIVRVLAKNYINLNIYILYGMIVHIFCSGNLVTSINSINYEKDYNYAGVYISLNLCDGTV